MKRCHTSGHISVVASYVQPRLRSQIVPPKAAVFAISESVDDYMKAILELGGADELPVATKALAERLRVRTPSVTGMSQRLAS